LLLYHNRKTLSSEVLTRMVTVNSDEMNEFHYYDLRNEYI